MADWRIGIGVGFALLIGGVGSAVAECGGTLQNPRVCNLVTNAPAVGAGYVTPGSRISAFWDSDWVDSRRISLCHYSSSACTSQNGGVVIAEFSYPDSVTFTVPASGLWFGQQYRVLVEGYSNFNGAWGALGWSLPFVLDDDPYVGGVTVNPVDIQQGSPQTIAWSASQFQESYSIYLYNSGGTAPIDMRPWGGGQDGWMETGGAAARSTSWNVPATLPPGSYRINVLVRITNEFWGSALSAPFNVLPTPTIDALSLSATRVQVGGGLTVSWNSTNQVQYAVYHCDPAGNCTEPPFLTGTTAESVVWSVPSDQPLTGQHKLRVRVWSSSGVSRSTLSATYTYMRAYVSFRSMDSIVDEGNTQVVPEVMVRTSDGGPTTAPITLTRSTVDGAATAPGDYTTSSAGATIPAGVADDGFASLPAVAVREDALNEFNEDFSLGLSNVAAAVLDDTRPQHMTHKIVIVDDDPVPSLTIGDPSLEEPDAGTVDAQFVVALSAATGIPVSVNYSTGDGTAAGGTDYAPRTGRLTIPVGSSSGTIRVPVLADTLPEVSETFVLNLSEPVNATLSESQAVATLLDPVRISVADVAIGEGDAGGSAANFVVSLSKPHGQPIAVAYATANATATAGADYVAASGIVTIPAGSVAQNVNVTVSGDTAFEADETFLLNLSGAPSGTRLLDAQGVASITNDDVAPTVSIGDVTVTEVEPSANVNAVFTVTLSQASGQAITVGYATSDGAAVAPSDYLVRTGVLTFAAGTTSRTVTVPVVGDNAVEGDESFFVNLSNPGPAGVVIADGQGVGTVVTDDFGLSIDDVVVAEGDAGTVDAVFAVTLSSPRTSVVTVRYATANDVATVGNDYTAASGTLTFAPGVTVQSLTIPVVGDVLNEADETFFVNLSVPTGAVLSDNRGVGTITDDDVAPTVSIGDVTVTEVEPGANVNAVFTVTLSQASGQAITVGYATSDGAAVAPSDYLVRTGVLTFAAGATSRTVTVPVVGDNVVEGDESFFVNLSNPGPAGVVIADGQGVGTVVTDDFGLSIDDVVVAEGNSGIVNAVFAVTLSSPRTSVVTVRYATANSTATAGSDYTTGSGTLTFAPGVTSQAVVVPVLGDVLNEADEEFFVNLNTPSGAVLSDNRGVGTISDDDVAPTVSIGDVTVTEVDPGSNVNAVFTVTLSQASGQEITVGYSTGDGTAVAPSDYLVRTGVLTFAAGTTSRTITVPVVGDNAVEMEEAFEVSLSNFNPPGVVADKALAAGIVLPDDFELSIDDAVVTEGNSGTVGAWFVASLWPPKSTAVTVGYATANSTATAGSDYVAANGTLTFEPGTTGMYVVVEVLGDTANEANEAFFVNLSSPTGAVLADNRGIGTISNDDGTTLANEIHQLPFRITTPGLYALGGDLVLTQPAEAAITVEADEVTLDLRGFTLSPSDGPGVAQAVGILAVGRRDLTVRGGVLRGFRQGVLVADPTRAAVRGTHIEKLELEDCAEAGINIQGAASLVRGNRVTRSAGGTAPGAGATTYGVRIEGPQSRILGNEVLMHLSDPSPASRAIAVAEGSASIVQGNRVAGSGLGSGVGIEVFESEDVVVTANEIEDFAIGVSRERSSGRFTDNVVRNVPLPEAGSAEPGEGQLGEGGGSR